MTLEYNNNFDFIRLFEQKLATYTGFKYAVCCDCCTNAILISLELANRLELINKKKKIIIPSKTYMSVPMTLINNGWNIRLDSDMKWQSSYQISPYVVDAAVGFHTNMIDDYKDNENINDLFVCVSFQQKKRLSLGRGGAILFNNNYYLEKLRRLVYDGRNAYLNDSLEIETHGADIMCGYHCYMEPDKAVQGILKINQDHLLPKYSIITDEDYPDLNQLLCLKDYHV
jgi:dTDP-4-amino-4,6-dideoxygalactose transaminase